MAEGRGIPRLCAGLPTRIVDLTELRRPTSRRSPRPPSPPSRRPDRQGPRRPPEAATPTSKPEPISPSSDRTCLDLHADLTRRSRGDWIPQGRDRLEVDRRTEGQDRGLPRGDEGPHFREAPSTNSQPDLLSTRAPVSTAGAFFVRAFLARPVRPFERSRWRSLPGAPSSGSRVRSRWSGVTEMYFSATAERSVPCSSSPAGGVEPIQ